VSFLLHLPALILTKTIDQVLQGAGQMGMCTRGFFGEHSEVLGAYFQMSNQATLGQTEERFLAATEDAVRKIVELERRARERVLAEARAEVEDKVFRSYGILRYARTLEVDEFLTLSSALRLGIECSLFTQLTIDELHRLMIMVMPAHLQRLVGDSLDAPRMRRERAALVGGYLKGSV
jgi:protein arginine kinase